ncbi:MAG: hypothetical protein JO044_12755 [Mycobacteriaceae bacterium]|nr:hypothetical protein [Mycobacteriaceae bacterium]MBV9641607.1 hypothetical protein [Mycobacteriaceae bacterium]
MTDPVARAAAGAGGRTSFGYAAPQGISDRESDGQQDAGTRIAPRLDRRRDTSPSHGPQAAELGDKVEPFAPLDAKPEAAPAGLIIGYASTTESQVVSGRPKRRKAAVG